MVVGNTASLDTDLLNTSQAAEILGVHSNTVRNWSDWGWLHPSLTPGGHRRYDRAEIRRVAFMSKRKWEQVKQG